jgi:predicted metal-dependent phosphotriesterase family hydrolase
VEQIIDVDSDDMYDWPWLYAVEVGHWDLNDSQAQRLRTYLDRGGFLMVDDFHGLDEWDTFEVSLKRIFRTAQSWISTMKTAFSKSSTT